SLAEKFFQQAIALDPNFADAYSGLASAQGMAGFLQFRIHDLNDALKSAESSARQAIALDGNNAAAHATLSQVLRVRGDRRAALAEAESALRSARIWLSATEAGALRWSSRDDPTKASRTSRRASGWSRAVEPRRFASSTSESAITSAAPMMTLSTYSRR